MTINELTTELQQDERNREYTARGIPPVFQINENAKILIVGQAPGKKVEETLIPFNDKSGEKLMDWMGIDKETFYSEEIAIVPMDFYYPGKGKTGDLPPRKFIAEEYHEKILEMMPNLKMTILIGNYSMKFYLKDRMKANLTETVRCFDEYGPDYFPIVHPSPLNFRWQKNNPWFEETVIPVLRRRVAECLGTRKTIHVVAAMIVRDGKIFATQRGYGDYKDGWEFPGGKVEVGETPEDAIVREIKEELDTEIQVDRYFDTIEYDYPAFHLSMKCYICRVKSGELKLLEHEAAKWLSVEELDSVDWLPADVTLIENLRHEMSNGKVS